jgi:exodeoxyribonuclease VII large subunit
MKPDAPTIAAGPAPPRDAPPRDAPPRDAPPPDAPRHAPPRVASPAPAVPGRIVYSVSRLNREVRSLLESGIGQLWVQGELSNLSRPASGHWYFSLKDRDAQVRCAMFRTRNSRALFEPREGQQVLARGRVSLYEPRGDYQLLVEQLEDAGLGALQRAFEALKQRLAAEGLFAPERKRPLPAAPRRIGVVTSPSGAAIRDILHILARRFPAASIVVYAVPVQGAAAVPAIVAALDLASARADCDVLILARGGGALEDLWAFNDERVARAIHRSRLPVVTGIGHEIDFTIADFVADLRAPTPSGAAELVVPDVRGWLQRLEQLQTRFAAAARRTLHSERAQLRALRQRLQSSHPGARLRSLALRLEQLQARAHFALQARLARLHSFSQRLDQLEERAQFALQARLGSQAARLQSLARALQAISPLSTLERGFAVITRSADGQLITAAEQLAVGESFDARLARGSLQATVIARRP